MAYKLMYNIINIIILPICMIMIIMMMISDDDHNYAKKVKVTYNCTCKGEEKGKHGNHP